MECGAFFGEPLLFFQSRTIRLIGPRSSSPLTRLIRIRHRFGLVPFSQRCFKFSRCKLGMEKFLRSHPANPHEHGGLRNLQAFLVTLHGATVNLILSPL
jgi:hypothetical protein